VNHAGCIRTAFDREDGIGRIQTQGVVTVEFGEEAASRNGP
jgi:hypothetical protein